jgi:outer membrane receptor protein involved in Fe transport
VLPVDSTGTPTNDMPESIGDGFKKTGVFYGLYVQDEWRILPTVTINAGLRLDGVDQFTQESQVSPRVNVVWKPTGTTTLHAGYARYFVPPPFELVGPNTLTLFSGTTAAPEVTQNDPVKAERSNYFDVGISQVIVPGLTVGVDAYYKISNNLIDEGQFGAPIILTAFNYAHGVQEGVEFTGSYDRGPWSIYGNLAVSRAVGKDITSAQFNFGPDDMVTAGEGKSRQRWCRSCGCRTHGARRAHHLHQRRRSAVSRGLARAGCLAGRGQEVPLSTGRHLFLPGGGRYRPDEHAFLGRRHRHQFL